MTSSPCRDWPIWAQSITSTVFSLFSFSPPLLLHRLSSIIVRSPLYLFFSTSQVKFTTSLTQWRQPRSLHSWPLLTSQANPQNTKINNTNNNRQTSSANHSLASPHTRRCLPFAGVSIAHSSLFPAAAGPHTLHSLAISPQVPAPSAVQ